MKRVLIFSEHDDLTNLNALPLADYDAVVLAFYASLEFVARVEQHGAKKCWRLNELLKDYATLVMRAYTLAHQVAASAPRYRDVNPLLAWENIIANALFIPLVMTEVHRALCERVGGDTTIVFFSRNDTQRAFETINQNSAPTFTIRVLNEIETNKSHDAGGRFAAWRKLIAEARRDGDWRNVIAVPIETLDAQYMWRSRLTPRANGSHREILFYSSYINFSRVLAKHAATFDAPPHWIVNNHSARKGLPRGAHVSNLWEYGALNISAHRAIVLATKRVIANALIEQEGFPLRAALASSASVREMAERVVPLFLSEIDLMHASLQHLQPRAVWTANQWASEGCMLQVAQAHNVPVTQVQHGTLEQYYTCAPIYSERFLVWDEFSAASVNQREKERVFISDPANTHSAFKNKTSPAKNARITFFSQPPQVVVFWNPSVMAWETSALLKEFLARGWMVTLRAHPMDQFELYTPFLQQADGALSDALTLDKGTPLEPLLGKTDIALMIFSSVAFDCIAHQIPVLGLGWYEFFQKRAVESAGLIAFANSFAAVGAWSKAPHQHHDAAQPVCANALCGRSFD